ncbi:MAG: hypothetical protein NW206_07390 [Hyphomonadaceae bacterium]|nr:hypothetical protein [Hyphomonadaceae bacterium]
MNRAPPPEPREPRALAVTLRLKDKHEHLLRRLGQAMVLHWDELSPQLQDVLIDQAVLVDDREAATQSEVETFVRSVKSMALPQAPASV